MVFFLFVIWRSAGGDSELTEYLRNELERTRTELGGMEEALDIAEERAEAAEAEIGALT